MKRFLILLGFISELQARNEDKIARLAEVLQQIKAIKPIENFSKRHHVQFEGFNPQETVRLPQPAPLTTFRAPNQNPYATTKQPTQTTSPDTQARKNRLYSGAQMSKDEIETMFIFLDANAMVPGFKTIGELAKLENGINNFELQQFIRDLIAENILNQQFSVTPNLINVIANKFNKIYGRFPKDYAQSTPQLIRPHPNAHATTMIQPAQTTSPDTQARKNRLKKALNIDKLEKLKSIREQLSLERKTESSIEKNDLEKKLTLLRQDYQSHNERARAGGNHNFTFPMFNVQSMLKFIQDLENEGLLGTTNFYTTTLLKNLIDLYPYTNAVSYE